METPRRQPAAQRHHLTTPTPNPIIFRHFELSPGLPSHSQIVKNLNQASVEEDEDVLAAINVEAFPDGATVILESIFGNGITYDASGGVSAAKAMLQVIL